MILFDPFNIARYPIDCALAMYPESFSKVSGSKVITKVISPSFHEFLVLRFAKGSSRQLVF